MISDDDELLLSPNSRMEQNARKLVENTLPVKSRAIYIKAYESFMHWKNEKQVASNTEAVFLNYFDELSKKYKSSTLWSTWSMLKTMMQLKHQVNLKNYTNLTAMLKRLSDGFKSKKSKVLTAQQIQDFINNAPNEKYLATKVALIFGISGACRGIELANITLQDVETDSKLQAINLPFTKTNKERKFVICGEYLNIVKSYQKLRPTNVTTNRFFLNYQNGRCTKQVIGKNKFANMPKEIATYLNLPNPAEYTGHCFRRTSATLLADSGANITTLKRHGGWKSDQVAEGYIEESIENKFNINQRIVAGINIHASDNPQPSTSTAHPQPSTSTAHPQPSTSTAHPQPSTSTAHPQPSTSTAQPQASTSTAHPQPSTSTAQPQASTSTAQQQSTEPITEIGLKMDHPPEIYPNLEQLSSTFTQETTTQNTINLPGKTQSINIKNCTNCTFNFYS